MKQTAWTKLMLHSRRTKCLLALALASTSLRMAAVVWAVAGDLDLTYGTYGIATTAIGPGDADAHAMAVQSDGKVVVVGYAFNCCDTDFAVARYTITGTLDSKFGAGGIVTAWDGGSPTAGYGPLTPTNDAQYVQQAAEARDKAERERDACKTELAAVRLGGVQGNADTIAAQAAA